MIPSKCDQTDKAHIRSCQKCLDYHFKLDITSSLPLDFHSSAATQKSRNFHSAFKIIYMMRYLKDAIYRVNSNESDLYSNFISEIQDFYVAIHDRKQKQNQNIEKCLKILDDRYKNVIIEDIFDAFSVIFHFFQLAESNSITENFKILVDEQISCICGFNLRFFWGNSIFFHIVSLENSLESLKLQIINNTNNSKCPKCKLTPTKTLSILAIPKYLTFKIVDRRERTERKWLPQIFIKNFRISEIFTTLSESEYILEILIVKIESEFEYFLYQSDGFFFSDGQFFNFTQAFKHIQQLNMIVVGVIYGLSEEGPRTGPHIKGNSNTVLKKSSNIAQNLKTSKIIDSVCNCGRKCNIGEVICNECSQRKEGYLMPQQKVKDSQKVGEESKNLRKNEEFIKFDNRSEILSKTQGAKQAKDASIGIKSITTKCKKCEKPVDKCACKENSCKSCRNSLTEKVCLFCRAQGKICYLCPNSLVSNLICYYCGGLTESKHCRKCNRAVDKFLCNDCFKKNCKACKRNHLECECQNNKRRKKVVCGHCSSELKAIDSKYCIQCSRILSGTLTCETCAKSKVKNELICKTCYALKSNQKRASL